MTSEKTFFFQISTRHCCVVLITVLLYFTRHCCVVIITVLLYFTRHCCVVIITVLLYFILLGYSYDILSKATENHIGINNMASILFRPNVT